MKKGLVNPASINDIELSPELKELQHLMPINSEEYNKLKNDIETANEIRDALKCYIDQKTGKFLLLGGFNRLEIAKDLKFETVPVQTYEGTHQDYKDLVINDNLSRRHLTSKDKRNLAAYFLKENPEHSNRTIADRIGISDKTVAEVRKELESTAEITQLDENIGADGRRRPTKKLPKQGPKEDDTKPDDTTGSKPDDNKIEIKVDKENIKSLIKEFNDQIGILKKIKSDKEKNKSTITVYKQIIEMLNQDLKSITNKNHYDGIATGYKHIAERLNQILK